MIAPDDKQAEDASQAIAVCRSQLDVLQRTIQQRQWAQASRIAASYSDHVRRLLVNVVESEADALIQLEIRHRRCMRMLSRQMNAVAEDISSIEQGQKKLHQSQSAAISLFQTS